MTHEQFCWRIAKLEDTLIAKQPSLGAPFERPFLGAPFGADHPAHDSRCTATSCVLEQKAKVQGGLRPYQESNANDQAQYKPKGFA